MRILHINKFFDFHGGAETYLHTLMEKQAAEGHEVAALSTLSEKNLPPPPSFGAVPRNDLTKSEGAGKDARKAVEFLWNSQAKSETERLLKEFRPDIVHLHNLYHHLSSSVLAPIRSAGIPCVQTLHDYKLACPNYKMFTEGAPCERCRGGNYLEAVKHHCLSASTLPNLLAAMEMGMTKMTQSYERTVKIFLCPTQFMADKMTAWGEPPSKMRVLPNPVELPTTAAQRDGKYLLYAGRMSPEKGVETLVRAALEVPEVELQLAGIGPDEPRLRALVKSSGATHVSFLGFLRRPELSEVRRHARAFVTPSIWYENGSLTVLEAMGEGLPVIASRIGALPEMVDERNGLLVTPADVAAWTAAIRASVAWTAEDLRRMGEAGRAKVEEKHVWKRHLAELCRAYADAGAS